MTSGVEQLSAVGGKVLAMIANSPAPPKVVPWYSPSWIVYELPEVAAKVVIVCRSDTPPSSLQLIAAADGQPAPLYTAILVSTPVRPSVTTAKFPLAGATHVYQTSLLTAVPPK